MKARSTVNSIAKVMAKAMKCRKKAEEFNQADEQKQKSRLKNQKQQGYYFNFYIIELLLNLTKLLLI